MERQRNIEERALGEVDRSRSVRQRVNRWLMTPQEKAIYDDVDSFALKLQRANQQLRSLTDDVGLYKSRQWDNLAQGDYNPEEISLEEYKKMLDYDSQVIAGWDLIKMGVLMKEWRITHSDKDVVDVLTEAFNRMRWPDFRSAMKNMLTAIAYGYSVTELVFDDYKGYWMPRMKNGLKTFDPETITFYTDNGGNLLKVGQKEGGFKEVELPLFRTLIWSHDQEWGNWYGKSLLRGCYKNWYIKDAMLKFANIAYERFGSPILLGIAASNTDMRKISEAIEHLYAYSQAVIRKTDERDPTDIKVIESKRTEMPFDRYIRYHDEMILRRMLIGQKLFEGGGGVYGPKVPLDLVFMRFEDFRTELTTVMNDMLQTICDLNWVLDSYPKFQFAPLTTMDQAAITQKLFEAIDRNVAYIDEGWVREELNFPPISDEFKDRQAEDARKQGQNARMRIEEEEEEPSSRGDREEVAE